MLRYYLSPKSISKPNFRACFYPLSLKIRNASGGREEGRAPSTAEEFTRQGIASQTVEKAYDGAAKAAEAEYASGDNSEAEIKKVREEIKKKEEGKNYHKMGKDDDSDGGLPINTFKGT